MGDAPKNEALISQHGGTASLMGDSPHSSTAASPAARQSADQAIDKGKFESGDCGKLVTVYSAATGVAATKQDIALSAFRMNAQGIAEPISKTEVRTTDPDAKLDITAMPGKPIGVDSATIGSHKVMNAAVHQACPKNP